MFKNVILGPLSCFIGVGVELVAAQSTGVWDNCCGQMARNLNERAWINVLRVSLVAPSHPVSFLAFWV